MARCRYYASDKELKRLFNSVNGLIFPGGLTDLYMDDPYVVSLPSPPIQPLIWSFASWKQCLLTADRVLTLN